MINSTPFSDVGASADALTRTQMPIEVKKFNHQPCKYLSNTYYLLTCVTIFFIACTGILRNWINIEIDSKLGETNCINNLY